MIEAHYRTHFVAVVEPVPIGELAQRVIELEEALEGLLARHCGGSEERHWAEWDTAQEALGRVGK